jgi:hypothetical protein
MTEKRKLVIDQAIVTPLSPSLVKQGDAVLAMMEREALRQAREWHDQFAHPLGCIGHCDPRLLDDKDERETNP